MLPTCEITDLILADHKKFLLLMADAVGHSIPNVAWSKVRSMLSPVSRFTISEPFMMAPELYDYATMTIFNQVVFRERGIIKLYISYVFKPYEAAGCYEFMLYGAPLDKPHNLDLPGVSHLMTRAVGNRNSIFSISTIEKSAAADIYSRLLEILDTESELRHKPKSQ